MWSLSVKEVVFEVLVALGEFWEFVPLGNESSLLAVVVMAVVKTLRLPETCQAENEVVASGGDLAGVEMLLNLV